MDGYGLIGLFDCSFLAHTKSLLGICASCLRGVFWFVQFGKCLVVA